MNRPHDTSYPTLSPDTDLEAEGVQLAVYRSMPVWRKVQLVVDGVELSRQLALVGLQARHPGASQDELRRRFLGLWLGEELAERIFGPLRSDSIGRTP